MSRTVVVMLFWRPETAKRVDVTEGCPACTYVHEHVDMKPLQTEFVWVGGVNGELRRVECIYPNMYACGPVETRDAHEELLRTCEELSTRSVGESS